MKQERFGLVEFVEHAVDEAYEQAGVEAHGAGGVEQHDQPQGPALPLAPHQLDRHAAMGNVAPDGAPQIDAPALVARPLAPTEPSAHLPGKTHGQRVRLRDGVRVGDLAKVRLRQAFRARGAFHAPSTAGIPLGIAALAQRAPARCGAPMAGARRGSAVLWREDGLEDGCDGGGRAGRICAKARASRACCRARGGARSAHWAAAHSRTGWRRPLLVTARGRSVAPGRRPISVGSRD